MKELGILPSEDELIREVEDSKAKKVIKKYFIELLGLVMILLFVSYFVFYDAYPILEGKTVSYVMDNNHIIRAKDFQVVFSKDAYDRLSKLYFDNQKTEVAMCLQGSIEGSSYNVNDFYIPKTRNKEVFSVLSEICNSKTIIAMHSHPYEHCIFSEVDINYYHSFKQISPEGIIGVMCEPKRFVFYRELFQTTG